MKIEDILAKILGHSNFKYDSEVASIENWTSLNHLRIIVEINKQFNLNLDPSDIHGSDHIQAVLDLVSGN